MRTPDARVKVWGSARLAGWFTLLQARRRRVLLAAVERRDQAVAAAAPAVLGALMGAW
ncbi:hypothetical protein ACI2VR_22990 [Ralstonia nicotianae]|uniref:hypothetical protein n=1 Tax=Ralstonia pseudosolanacearum TaxID=1310165 RepID=UPI00131546B0|nr:hypothetical protein [Ralstonia pseudosolanacearum]BCM11233.1 hypothetical protein MAFF241648_04230 [Ralstonia solanacearum]